MPKFRKKPVVVEAQQFCHENTWPFAGDAQYRFGREDYQFAVYDTLHDTWVNFEDGDYIIRGIQGEFYPCKADVFEATYAPVEE
jgi:hypothetical protein